MNLYQPSLAQYSQLAHVFSTLNQPIQHQPLVNIPSQPAPRHPTAYINALNQSQLAQNKNLAAYDFVTAPTKRVRHTQQDFTESPLKVEEVQSNSRGFVARNGLGNGRDTRIIPSARQYIPEREESKRELVNIPLSVIQKPNNQSMDFGDELTIPALKGFGLAQQRAENAIKHQILQQLQRQQQQFENFMQHQIAQQMEHQKLELDQMMYRMQEARRQEMMSQESAMFNGLPNLQLNHMQSQRQLNSHKLIGLGESNFSLKTMNVEKSPEDFVKLDSKELKVDDDYQYIKMEDYNEKSSEDSGNGLQAKKKIVTQKLADKPKKTAYAAMKEAKKRRNQNYDAEYFGIIGKNLLGRSKEEPRRRNKWQKKDGSAVEEEEKPVVQTVETVVQSEIVEAPQEVLKVKPPKPVEIPQYLQDDSQIDYKGMLALTITNDPALTGLDNMKFVAVRKDVKTTDAEGNEGVINDTRVGTGYQANIPELKEKGVKEGKGRRRCPEVMWKPGTMSENDMKRYFEDLCKILKCDEINEERALKLLKRKNFKKEKVKVNITKNEKFYSSFLVVSNVNNNTTEESFPQ